MSNYKYFCGRNYKKRTARDGRGSEQVGLDIGAIFKIIAILTGN